MADQARRNDNPARPVVLRGWQFVVFDGLGTLLWAGAAIECRSRSRREKHWVPAGAGTTYRQRFTTA